MRVLFLDNGGGLYREKMRAEGGRKRSRTWRSVYLKRGFFPMIFQEFFHANHHKATKKKIN